jgi:hypothetical protein
MLTCDCKRPVPRPDGMRCRRCGFTLPSALPEIERQEREREKRKADLASHNEEPHMKFYECTKCQSIHYENGSAFAEHIMYQSKHGIRDKTPPAPVVALPDGAPTPDRCPACGEQFELARGSFYTPNHADPSGDEPCEGIGEPMVITVRLPWSKP